ncbi:MAG TPA: DUF885 domain-containing protein [Terriglobia bacterium]|nr:DUF885 domain-containing protein [Terriglobia bacterium]
MNCFLSVLVAVSCLMAVVAQVPDEKSVEARRAGLKAALQEEWEHHLRANPEAATAVGDHRYNDRLSDCSPEFYAGEVRHAQEALRVFEAIDTTGFPEQERLSQVLMVRELREQIEGAKFKDWEMPIDQMNGWHLGYAMLPFDTTFRTAKDYQDYIARLHQLPRVFSQMTENMRAGLRDHLVQPRYLLEKTVLQAQDIAGKPVEDSPFAQPARTLPAGISEREQKALREAIFAAVKQEVSPAYARLAEFLRTEYVPQGRAEYGVWSLPDGDARYRFDIKQMTTTDLGPEEIHQMGLKQVAEIEAEMLKLARSQGYEDLPSFNAHIRKDPRLYGTSGKQLLDLYTHYTDQMYARLPQLFDHLPKNQLVVLPMEAFRAPNAPPADYSIGAGDGSRPGRINVNEYDPQHRLLLNVEATAYHEGIPGHHLQFSVAQEQTSLPAFRRFAYYNAYSEGWAFYAERLGREVGFYQDPYSEYGRLENEMWRSVRLVVDTGVHAQHWSREQMVDFFRQHTAMDEPNIASEVDRYIAWPGQALAYKLGQMKIIELRERARQQLGSRFDLRAFHDALLADGPLPLDVLEQNMDRWIAAQASGTPPGRTER